MSSTPSVTLITGASGLQGRAFLEGLGHGRSSEHRAVGLRRPESAAANQADLKECDYTQTAAETLQREFPSIREIIHCAGVPAVFASLRDPVQDHRNNFDPILFTLRLARMSGAAVTLVSSAEVYGESKDRTEQGACLPENFYGLNKSFSEQYLLQYHRHFGTKYQILRPSVLIGEGLKRNLVFDILSAFQRRDPKVRIFCTPDSCLDFVHVDDVVSAHQWLGSHGVTDGIWNVSSGELISPQLLIGWLRDRYGWNPEIEVAEANRQKKDLPNGKLLKTGWKPAKSFFQRFEEMVGKC